MTCEKQRMGVVYYYFQGSLGKADPDHEIAGGSSQRHRVKNGKKQDSEAMTPKTTGGPNDAAPKEETDVLSQDEGEETKKARKEIAVYTSEASEVDIKEETPEGWVPQLLRKLWLGWFPASDFPKTQNRE
ncbi:hypothetical protein CB1_000168009 [Camelus ferus]|nr:hypothetical protein CB1_000168009 [Camelus ferus]